MLTGIVAQIRYDIEKIAKKINSADGMGRSPDAVWDWRTSKPSRGDVNA
jgi:hypothetical protein